MLMIALTAKQFSQSPYEYLFGPRLKLAIDYFANSLILEAEQAARDEAEQRNATSLFNQSGLYNK